MALLDNANERGDFNSTGRGARASQGVDYFSNVVPGLQSIQSDTPPDVGWRAGPEEQFIRSGGTLDTGPRRDLKTDPLSGTEAGFLNVAQDLIGAFMPFGFAINTGIDFNLGQMNADQKTSTEVGGLTNRESLGYYGGLAMGQGMSPTEAAKFAFDTRRDDMARALGLTPQQNPDGVSVTDINADGTRTIGEATTTPVYSGEVTTTELGPLGETPSGGGGHTSDRSFGMGLGHGEAGVGGVTTGGYGSDASAANGGLATDSGFSAPVGLSVPGYADGGPMMPNGPLLAMGFAGGGQVAGMGNPGGDVSPDMINMRVNQLVRDPRFVQSITQTLQPLMQSGELTPQEVQVMGQIAEASLQNPKLYPQLRQFVAQQGMTPLPPSFDPTVITKILAISRALAQAGGGMSQPGQATPPGQIPPTDQAQMQNPTGMANGGLLQGPGTGRSDSIGTVNESTGQPVKVATGEYVIPEHVVRAKGRDFFDALLRRYASVPKAGE